MAFVSISQGDQVALATETGDDGTLTDKTACLTDDSSAVSCVEVKVAFGIRAEIPMPPAAINQALTTEIRLGVQSIMTAGTLRIAPYSDANTIINTNGVTTVSIGAGGNFDTAISDAFIDDLGDLGGYCAIRIFENGSLAKIKTGEVDYDITLITNTLAGVTRDDAGAILVSCEYSIHPVVSTGPLVIGAATYSGTSNGTTGAYSETVSVGDYVVRFHKDLATDVQDITGIITIAAP